MKLPRVSLMLLLTSVAVLSVLSCLNLSGCASSRENPKWHELSIDKFEEKINNSKSDQLWNYCGSDNTHHYFCRMPMRMFLGLYYYCRISKDEYTGIPKPKERALGGGYSFAFSTRAEDENGFTHSLSRGLVEDVLKPTVTNQADMNKTQNN